MRYHTYEFNHALVAPLRTQASGLRRFLDYPCNPIGQMAWARITAASCEVFEG